MRVLITGGCGFIGSNFIRMALSQRPSWDIVNLDALTYAGNPANLADVEAHPRYRFLHGDLRDASLVTRVIETHPPELVIHFAAESHVDRSIAGPLPFMQTNVMGTAHLLDALHRQRQGRLVHISTDEVYGPLALDAEAVTEEAPLKPSSPYAASKAAADLQVLAYARTYGLQAMILRGSNNYGPFQYPEKLIPLMTVKAMQGQELPLYGDGLQRRDWLHVDDFCRGILAATDHGRWGATYNLGGGNERSNLEIVTRILRTMNRSEESIRLVADRPGHDRRYAIDSTLAKKELGWTPQRNFEQGLEDTIRWYLDHKQWWKSAFTQEG